MDMLTGLEIDRWPLSFLDGRTFGLLRYNRLIILAVGMGVDNVTKTQLEI